MKDFISYYSEQGQEIAKIYGTEDLPYNLMPKFAAHSRCEEAFNDLCKLVMKGICIKAYTFIRNDYYIIAKQRYDTYINEEKRLEKTCRLNNIGIACEKKGDIQGAINAYEECATIGYEAEHCYTRLRIIYRRLKDYDSMARIIRRYAEVYRMGENWAREQIERYSLKQRAIKESLP